MKTVQSFLLACVCWQGVTTIKNDVHMSGKHIVMLHDIGTACVSINVEQTGTDLFKKMAKVTTVLL